MAVPYGYVLWCLLFWFCETLLFGEIAGGVYYEGSDACLVFQPICCSTSASFSSWVDFG